MKKFYLLLLTLTLALGTAAAEPAATEPAATEPAATEPAAVEPTAEESGWTRNLNNVGRGAANIVTCFLEIPRCMVYRNSQVPFWGFIDGAVRGSGLTVLRAFSGVTDLVFLGFDYGKMYNQTDFRDYVWESPWLPR